MDDFEFDVDEFFRGLDFASNQVQETGQKAMEDVVNELGRVASEIAPHDKGTLEKSYKTNVSRRLGDNAIIGEVAFSIREGRFNYALWTHETDYNLGPGSLNKPGTQGWSGNHYNVGNKYLERPLMGESDAYKRYIAEKIREELA